MFGTGILLNQSGIAILHTQDSMCLQTPMSCTPETNLPMQKMPVCPFYSYSLNPTHDHESHLCSPFFCGGEAADTELVFLLLFRGGDAETEFVFLLLGGGDADADLTELVFLLLLGGGGDLSGEVL